jgi:hypothetical protein
VPPLALLRKCCEGPLPLYDRVSESREAGASPPVRCSRERLTEALGALRTGLGKDDLAAIEAAVPAEAVAGERYPAAAMAQLDSERPGC